MGKFNEGDLVLDFGDKIKYTDAGGIERVIYWEDALEKFLINTGYDEEIFSGISHSVIYDRDPTINDINFTIPTLWINNETGALFILTGIKLGEAVWSFFYQNDAVITVINEPRDPNGNDFENIGALWINTISGESWVSLGDDGQGVAIWSTTNPKEYISSITDTTDPLNTNWDYKIGTIWINTLNQNVYILVDNTENNAVWKAI